MSNLREAAPTVVEPVAWRCANASPPGGYVVFHQYPQALKDLGQPIEPLYTAPPRAALSDEQVFGLYERTGLSKYHIRDYQVQCEYDRLVLAFVRAIEAAHGIGDKE